MGERHRDTGRETERGKNVLVRLLTGTERLNVTNDVRSCSALITQKIHSKTNGLLKFCHSCQGRRKKSRKKIEIVFICFFLS